VLCIPVTIILERLGIYHLDLWLLDTDGTEADILKSLDTTKVTDIHHLFVPGNLNSCGTIFCLVLQITVDVIAFQEERAVDEEHKASNKEKRDVMLLKGYDCAKLAAGYRWCVRMGFEPNNKVPRPAI
jgi:hypothetical protein